MRKWNRFGKRIITYTTAAVLVFSGLMVQSGITSHAATYIQYDCKVRDAAGGEEVVDGLKAGAQVKVLSSGTSADGSTWNQVEYTSNGTTKRGWVRADLMGGNAPADQETDNNSDTTKTDNQTKQEPQENNNDNKSDGQDTTKSTAEDEQKDKEPESKEPEKGSDGADTSADVSAISGDGYLPDGEDSFFVRGESMKISGQFNKEDIPQGFSETKITYNGKEINVLKADKGELFLFYLKGEEGGDFYVYDTEKNCVVSFIKLTAGDASVILALPPLEEKVASSYEKTIFAVNETDGITGYLYNQNESTMRLDAVAGEYYYIYGMSADGTYQWFLYDNVEKTFVRSATDLSVDLNADSEKQQKETQSWQSIGRIIIIGAGIVFLILLLIIISLGIRCRRLKKHIPEEELEEEEEEPQEEPVSRAERRRERRRYRHFMEDDEEAEAEDIEAEPESAEPEGEHGEEVLVVDGEEYGLMGDAVQDSEAEVSEPERASANKKKKEETQDNWDDDLEFLDL